MKQMIFAMLSILLLLSCKSNQKSSLQEQSVLPKTNPSISGKLVKKGIDVSPMEAYEDLGIKHVKLNTPITQYLSKVQKGGYQDSYAFKGKTYYYNKTALKVLDDQIAELNRRPGTEISFVLLVHCGPYAHPDAMIDNQCDRKKGLWFMPDLTTPESVAFFESMIDFMVKRFKNQNVKHWVVFNEIDAQWVWTNAGLKTLDDFMKLYVQALKIVSDALKTDIPDATAYVSLTKHWNEAPLEGQAQRDLKAYRPVDIIKWLVNFEKINGKFKWGIAKHPYGNTPWKAASDQTYGFDTGTTSLANIELMDQLVECPQMKFMGQVRKIILSEQGFTTTGLDSESKHTASTQIKGEENQAASLLYTMAKLRYLSNIEAFHYHRFQDHPAEGRSDYGLITKDGRKKLSYEVYKRLKPDASNAFDSKEKIFVDLWEKMLPERGINPKDFFSAADKKKFLVNSNLNFTCSMLGG